MEMELFIVLRTLIYVDSKNFLSDGVVCFSWLFVFSCIYDCHGLCVCYWI